MASNILVDNTKDFTKRELMTAQMPIPDEIPSLFKHTPPSGKPTAPAFPGALSGPEQLEVKAWLDGLTAPTLAAAITWVGLYQTFNNAMDTWKFANYQARLAQYMIAHNDSLILNKPTLSQSSDATGAGSAPPGPTIPRDDP